jgi:acetyl esterase/lipase
MGPLIALAMVALPGGVHGDLFVPEAGGRHSAVVLLHGGALSLGDEADTIVDYYGGISGLAPLPARLPPTLILHGDADSTVPVGKARRLAAVLDERRVPHEMHLYAGADHVFDANRSPGSAGQDAWACTVAFLRAH